MASHMASKAILNKHQKHANYGPFIDIPVVYITPAAGLLCLPVLEKICLVSMFPPNSHYPP